MNSHVWPQHNASHQTTALASFGLGALASREALINGGPAGQSKDVSNKDCSLVSKSVKSYFCVSYDTETQVDYGTWCQEEMQQVSCGNHFKQKNCNRVCVTPYTVVSQGFLGPL